ncbi:putative bifunctional diguanylate cyclase/phosphodiesterase [Roseibium sp.]|uniref:putative bifunctional diguanylate cyclase/phosphodiesterase n=1 Tax=Roseibium sp. TaxID=1936156 RepID=UPI003A96FF6F
MKAVTEGSGGRIANAIIIPMIAVVVLAVACVFGLMIWSSHTSDKSAVSSQQTLLDGAITLKLDQMARQQVGTVVWDQAYFKSANPVLNQPWLFSNVGRWLDDTYGFSRAILISRESKPAFSYDANLVRNWDSPELMNQLEHSVARVRAKYITSFKRTPSGLFRFTADHQTEGRALSENGLVAIDGQIYFFSAAAITQEVHTIAAVRRPPAVLISFQPMNEEALAKIARISGLSQLHYTNAPSDDSAIANIVLKSPKGNTIGYLEWRANRPGTEMLGQVTPVLLILALAIVGLTIGVMDFTRQTTKKLASSQAEAIHTARHDSLSGLPNRSQFSQLLQEALKLPQSETDGSAVVYIDLDRFKDINDTLGHAAGDEVIRAVAARLQAVIPDNGVIARISGDEFAMLLTHCDGQDWVEHILSRIQDQLVRPIRIENNELFVSLSMGAAMAPRDGIDSGELLRKADIALYDAKGNGRGRWSFFDPSMQEHVLAQDKMSRELRRAIDEDALEIAYQPQCDAKANRIVAIEALARWTHPDIGPISPASFIPLAEDTGLINDLGLWVLRRACRDAHRWPDLVVSVNVSPTQFKHPRFVEKVLETLEDFHLPPGRLEIEVTENVFASQHKTILTSMKRLKDLGVKVALDDFGSGYSSLSYLRRFPFDTLKIDRDFISNLDQSQEALAILTTIIHLGKALGMTTVAEGIETREQIAFLSENGCNRMQGYLISRPLGDAALEAFLEDHAMDIAMKLADKTVANAMGELRTAKA